MGYKWIDEEETTVVKDGSLYIPVDEGNRHYREFLRSGDAAEPWKTPEEIRLLQDLEDRITLLESEKEATNIRDITPQQAKDYIDAQFAAATTNAQVVVAIKRILKKMVVFLLR